MAVLARSELTHACPPALLTSLFQAGQIHQYPDQTYLCHFGDPLPDLILLLEGNLEASRVGMGGKRHVVAYLKVGQFFGLLTVIDRKGAPQDIRCHGDATVLRVPMDTVRRLCEESPQLQQSLLALICERNRALYDAMSAQALLPLNARVAFALQWVVSVHGMRAGERQVLNLTISQTAIADQLGVARQSVNRELKLMERNGVLRLGKAQIEILDLARLQHLAAGGT
jgi:CRP/FNR family transcriptional regulator, cyclic AMP receptor protein